jgi:hypothetical protein
MLPRWFNVVKLLITYTLCVTYSAWIGFGLLISYIFKKDPKFWKPKERPVAPSNLQSEEFGKHKFAHVNVIKLLLSLPRADSFRGR